MKFTKYHSMALIGVIVSLGVIALAVILIGRNHGDSSWSGRSWQDSESSGEVITREYDISPDVSKVEVSLFGDLTIRTGTPGLTVTGDSGILDEYFNLDQRGQGVELSFEKFRFGGNAGSTKIELTLASLDYLKLDGASDTKLEGLSGESLILIMEGAANIQGQGDGYKNIKVQAEGAGNIDLRNLPTENAEVNLDGAGSIKLNLQGGVLSGTLNGLGSIEYQGEVSAQTVKVNGLGSVERQE